MSTKDIGIYESGNGGEISVLNNDILLAEQLYQQAYLACFGGQVEANTRGDEVAGQLRTDWWGNSLFFSDTKAKQFNSETERALLNNALNSTGRINIIRAVQADLKYLSSIASVVADATILSVNKIMISINLTEPATNQTTLLQVIWDGAKGELVVEETL